MREREALLAPGALPRLPEAPPRLVERRQEPVDEGVVVERLLDEVERAELQRLHGHRHVAVAGEEDDGPGRAQALGEQPLEELDAAHAVHAHVEQDAAGRGRGRQRRARVGEERLAGGVGAGGEVARAQQPGERVAKRLLVVDDVDHWPGGSWSWNSVPSAEAAGS